MDEKVIIFDMDGTLIDSERFVMECWEETGKNNGLKDIRKLYMKTLGTNEQATEVLFREYYGIEMSFELFRTQISTLFYKRVADLGIPVKKGAVELLEFLSRHGYRIGLATSTKKSIAEKELKDLGLLKYFEIIVGGDMVERSKPHGDIFRRACALMKTEPGQTYAAEDSYNGVRSAYSAGMKVLMIPDMVPADEEMRQKCFKIFSSLTDVRSYFEGQNDPKIGKG